MEKNKINNLNSYEVNIEDLSPGMKQYINIRRKAKPDTILLYRMGDFYETFFEDAITISRDLDIVLTSRDAGKVGKVPLAGIPAKSVEVYVAKLLEKFLLEIKHLLIKQTFHISRRMVHCPQTKMQTLIKIYIQVLLQ